MAKTTAIEPAELWIIQPPDPPATFSNAVAYLVDAGVDIAFGPGDTLPTGPPPSLDGIKGILALFDDLPRIQDQLRGFRGFEPDQDPPYDTTRPICFIGALHGSTDPDIYRKHFIQSYLHQNDRTWLSVYGTDALFNRRLECPLLLTGDLTLKSPKLTQRLLARPDRDLRDEWINDVLVHERTKWSDISFNIGKALLDDYEITGDQRCLERAIALYSRMIDPLPPSLGPPACMPAAILARLYEVTGDKRFAEPIRRILDETLEDMLFKKGGQGWCHATQAFSAETLAYLKEQVGDMGSYGEAMCTTYYPTLAMASVVGRQDEIATLIAECVREQRKHLRDEKTGLYWHGIPGRQENLDGFIGHGSGWTAMGLVHLLDYFPTDHSDYDEVLSIFRELCQDAAKFQGEDGSFHSILNYHWTPYCVHYVSWLGCAFLRGARKGYLDEVFVEKGLKAWEATKMRSFQGRVIGLAAGTPVSRRMEYYQYRYGVMRLDKCIPGPLNAQPLFLLNEVMRLSG